jgi:hypothetical protein
VENGLSVFVKKALNINRDKDKRFAKIKIKIKIENFYTHHKVIFIFALSFYILIFYTFNLLFYGSNSGYKFTKR